jgi:glycosyltransferase involved in cell wall biosynthesis
VKISCTIITYNEEAKIKRCLDSVFGIADEIVVVDSFSTDNTINIAKTFNSVTLVQSKFEGHIQQKNYALELAKFDYVLSLDADELLSEKLAEDIIKIKVFNSGCDAYVMPRLNNYCGKWIYHSGWYPDKKVRLWKKSMGKWGGTNPHDKVILDEGAAIEPLNGDILHYTMDSIEGHIMQEKKFAKIAATALFEQKSSKNGFILAFLNPPFTFVKKYFLQLGILDGWYGFTISAISAYGKFLKYYYLFKLNKAKKYP